MNRIRNTYQKMSFLNKVRISFGLLILLPVLILEIFVLYSSASFIKEQQRLEAKETIARNYQNIENQMAVCNKSLLYVVSNGMLRDFLNISDDEYIKRNSQGPNISALIYNTLLSNQYFKDIKIYSDKNIAVNNAIFKNVSELDDLSWYEKTMKTEGTLWWYEDGECYITRRIVNSLPKKELGVIRIKIKDDIFYDNISMFAGIPVEICLSEDDHIFLKYQSEDIGSIKEAAYKSERRLYDTDWKISYSIDKSYFSNILHPKMVLSFVIVLILLFVELFALNYSTKSLLKYLYKIIGEVKKVKDNNFQIHIEESSQDEIGELARSINQMLKKIQLLIDEVYKSKLDQKNLELDLLQSKINPHFLYNNLSAINWIAIETGEDRIYEITTQLATFYRTALNKGVSVDKLAVEIENIKAYIRLQLIAHEDSFEVEYRIDPMLLEEEIPIFIMQPLVENAIEHGIDTLRDKKGKIMVDVGARNDQIIIEIKDNGTQLYEKIGEGRMPESDFGYGVSNVNKRIRLLCGEPYGVVISADKSGTTSRINIRKKILALGKKS